MRKTLLLAAVAVIVSGAVITGCATPAEKVQDAQTDVQVANENLDKANEEYLTDIDAYRKEANEKIAANEKSLIEFKARVATQKKEARAEYEAKINELEHRNSDMKKQIDEYKADGKDKWAAFKQDFGKSMEDMGESFKNLGDKK